MQLNGKTGLALVMIALAAGTLSACKSDSDSNGGQSAQGGITGPANTANSGHNAADVLDDGILHVWPQEVADRVFFDLDKSVVKPEGRDVLNKWVAFLQSHPKDQLLVEGHSDEHGTREYNLALGERRAAAIKQFLVAGGIQAERVKTVSYGKERPAVTGSNEAAYAQNRRGVGLLQ